ncbi:hypothetical protein ACN38_g12431 [Penicillium nordicum]|uniref:Uncharacterized protein n=1 Tax=Penicillium nordicum TaxID=229535 RepID=A0A0M9W9Z3_9EURO|nr:hypothetical protein ACN38_g12431 [Penicillium nordicum]
MLATTPYRMVQILLANYVIRPSPSLFGLASCRVIGPSVRGSIKSSPSPLQLPGYLAPPPPPCAPCGGGIFAIDPVYRAPPPPLSPA